MSSTLASASRCELRCTGKKLYVNWLGHWFDIRKQTVSFEPGKICLEEKVIIYMSGFLMCMLAHASDNTLKIAKLVFGVVYINLK